VTAVLRRYFTLRTEGYAPSLAWKLALVDCGRY